MRGTVTARREKKGGCDRGNENRRRADIHPERGKKKKGQNVNHFSHLTFAKAACHLINPFLMMKMRASLTGH